MDKSEHPSSSSETGNLVPCRECGSQIARTAKTCPHCGVDSPGYSGTELAVGKVGSGIAKLIKLFVIAVIITVIFLYWRYSGGQPKPKITNGAAAPQARVIDGGPDAGYIVSADIANEGSAGAVRVSITLRCSEGEWQRHEDISLEAGDSQRVAIFFPEPTIAASDVEFQIKASPAK